MVIALVGVGTMGEAVLSGLARWGKHELLVVNRRTERDRELEERYEGVRAATLEEAAASADVLVVAVKPRGVCEVLGQAAGHLREQAVVVSLAAGMPLAVMERQLREGQPLVRVMPNTPSLVGRGVSALSPSQSTSEEDLERVREVMQACGHVVVVPEDQQDVVTSISGSGPAYLFHVADAMVEAAVQMGLSRPTATDLVAHTIDGAGAMLREPGAHPASLREGVTSPGGTTAQALRVLDQDGVRSAFSRAMHACRDRSAEMSREAEQA
ncbi:pyrroline-5-carboxylate reductase [Luteococcus sp.]|uniref:pyrroline-5-carboxylate reductase n=1 Tax=Luteococcus sp. TaxID=1969402 RepID=UPI003735369B